jgi:hypothetical protein
MLRQCVAFLAIGLRRIANPLVIASMQLRSTEVGHQTYLTLEA